jgi:putative Mg2+ transporter-C (MgtC) family protein
MWETFAATVLHEFSDLADPADLARVVVRVVLAATLGAIIGWERETRGSSAGLRTHILVAVGVALLVVASEQGGMDADGVSRIIQGVFAGIGFLGAGAILKQAQKEEVRGLTTAASLWATAAIGTAAGLGREATAIIATLFVFVVLSVLLRVERRRSQPDR